MIFQLCLFISVASAAMFDSSAGKNGHGGERGAATVDVDGGKKRKREPTFTLNGTATKHVVAVFNHERSLVGASNMNYVVCFSLK